MSVEFESDYRNKVLFIRFTKPRVFARTGDVLSLRSLWIQELTSWHSPYKALIDCSGLEIKETETGEVRKALETMMASLKGFFLKKAVGYGYSQAKGHGILPFEVYEAEEEARKKVGLEKIARCFEGESIRNRIFLDNHFRQHVVEMGCTAPVDLKTDRDLKQLNDKLMNNLMQWHSSWSLLIDCSSLRIEPSLSSDFERLEKKFRGFFLKKIVGYSPAMTSQAYPFRVYRVRHRAAAELEAEGLFSGEEADCQSRKKPEKK